MIDALNDANGIVEDTWLKILNTVPEHDVGVKDVSCFGGRYYLTEAQRKRLRNLIPFMSSVDRAWEGINRPMTSAELLALPAHFDGTCGRCKSPVDSAKHEFSFSDTACSKCFTEFQNRAEDPGFKYWKESKALTLTYKMWRAELNEDIPAEKQLEAKCSRCTTPFHEATGTVINPKDNIFLCGPCSGRFYAHRLRVSGWRVLNPKQLKKLDKKKSKEAKREVKEAKALAKLEAKKAAEHDRLYGRPREAQAGISMWPDGPLTGSHIETVLYHLAGFGEVER